MTDKGFKENGKTFLKFKLVEDEVLTVEDMSKHDVISPAVTPEGLTFEQKREVLMIKLEHDKMIP